MEKLKPFVPFLSVLAVTIPVIILLVPSTQPHGGIRLHFDAEGAEARSEQRLDSLGVSVAGFSPGVEFRFDRPLLRQVEQEFGLERSAKLLREEIPAYYWEIRWKKEKTSLVSRGTSGPEDAAKLIDALKGEVSLRLSTRGELVRLERKIPDSVMIPGVTAEEAKQLAASVLRRHSALATLIDFRKPESEKTISQPSRTDYEFVWGASLPQLSNRARVKTLIAGNVIARIETEFGVPEQYASSRYATAVEIATVLVYVTVMVIMIVIAFKRFRSFEMGFRLAMALGIVTSVVVAGEIFVSFKGEMGWEILFPLLLGPLFIGGALVPIWAVAESMGRETWKDKFISLDLLSNGYLFHSRVGASMIRGISLGAVCLALWLGLTRIADSATHASFLYGDDNILRQFEVAAPGTYVLGHSFYTCAYVLALFVVFLVSFLRRRVVTPLFLIPLSGFLLGIVFQRDMLPLWVGVVVQTIVGIAVIWIFFQYDTLSAFVALLAMTVGREIAGFFLAGHPSYALSGTGLLILFGIFLAGGFVSLYRKSEITDFDSITPAFEHFITERQRLQQELEIARHVQMSFLPKENPKIAGLDIASRCVPALEVGGDYYDFIVHGPRKLSVAIGDVSGKGTQAAFYMTLAKGFLRALSNSGQSAKDVLRQINRLFYENVERGAFISMVYAVFDLRARKLALTRAGHNPVLVWKAKTAKINAIQPSGLALGLEDGKKFSRTIQEVRIPFYKGDCFIFYTDGFTEAMNRAREEFGQERFVESVRRHMGGSAEEIVENIFGDMRAYIGKARQHDDMTIVVVKTTS